MKTNTLTHNRPLATAALLLTLFVSQSACESAEPVKPQPATVHILPSVAPDTLPVHPYVPKPVDVDSDPAATVQPSGNESD